MKKYLIIVIVSILILNSCTVFRRQPQSIQSFMNRTEHYKELRYIMHTDAITRLDCAYLFALFMPSQSTVNYYDIPLDLRLKLYSKTAYSTVQRGFMSVFPDNTFKPDEKIQRYQIAIFISRYIASVDPFFDKGMEHIDIMDTDETFFAYKPLQTVVSRNIIEMDKGRFRPYDYVTGTEAIEYFHRLSKFY